MNTSTTANPRQATVSRREVKNLTTLSSMGILSRRWDRQHRTQTHPHPSPLPSDGRGRSFANLVVNAAVSSVMDRLNELQKGGLLLARDLFIAHQFIKPSAPFPWNNRAKQTGLLPSFWADPGHVH